MCQVIDRYILQSRKPDTEFSKKAALLRQCLPVVLVNMSGVIHWEHRAFNKAGHNLSSWDGVDCNPQEQFILYKSYRGAILKAFTIWAVVSPVLFF